jgi:hypothetical protein
MNLICVVRLRKDLHRYLGPQEFSAFRRHVVPRRGDLQIPLGTKPFKNRVWADHSKLPTMQKRLADLEDARRDGLSGLHREGMRGPCDRASLGARGSPLHARTQLPHVGIADRCDDQSPLVA